ncbi:hypothetical protein MATL_G00141210 [Megalops atlanticus]|uniref:Uncharacterized protein n=1 Tax=Megalops atlanticus TaxID=7932 RepID=A0A9D3PWH2_MEGAT|nr:hypothetical protein MATL_G00141210 [Megalops atlanticus]
MMSCTSRPIRVYRSYGPHVGTALYDWSRTEVLDAAVGEYCSIQNRWPGLCPWRQKERGQGAVYTKIERAERAVANRVAFPPSEHSCERGGVAGQRTTYSYYYTREISWISNS